MPLKSMTGFGRAEGATAQMAWAWEARSVNGRGLDIRLRLPPGIDALEPKVRERVQALFVRGSINLTLTVKRQETAGDIRVNPQAIKAVAEAVAQMRTAIGQEGQINIDGLLSLRGVLEYGEAQETEAEADARTAALLASLEVALKELIKGRGAEGQRLEDVLAAQVSEVETLVAQVAASPARTPEVIQLRLKEQIDRLVGSASGGLDPARLHQEAMLIATRIDVDEELKRLTAHVAAARDLLNAKEPVGRKFDFLTQEFNREANTLCSKANDADITRAGLALKAVIDQMREQVQNIE
jgi:uncharacterized protein (TIGR00255 family)